MIGSGGQEGIAAAFFKGFAMTGGGAFRMTNFVKMTVIAGS